MDRNSPVPPMFRRNQREPRILFNRGAWEVVAKKLQRPWLEWDLLETRLSNMWRQIRLARKEFLRDFFIIDVIETRNRDEYIAKIISETKVIERKKKSIILKVKNIIHELNSLESRR